MNENPHSPNFELVRDHYENEFWNEAKVRRAVVRHWITEEECEEILSNVHLLQSKPG